MNKHARRLQQELETLGFRRDYDHPSKQARVYRHANQPDQVIKVFDAMTDNSITAARRLANKIADTGWSGPRQPQKIKDRARIKKASEKAAAEKEKAEYERRADEAARRKADRQRAVEVERKRREIERLMSSIPRGSAG